MKDYVTVNIKSNLDKTSIHAILLREFPEFTWRMGDSDALGGYVSGLNPDDVQVECWTSENPMDLAVSFRSTKVDAQMKEQLLNKIIHNVSSYIGDIVRIDK